ncbi:MAG: benzoate/H(+) symporter BenE family transporter [Paracoccaceae bacterium]
MTGAAEHEAAPAPRASVLADLSPSAIAAGFLVVLVSYSGPLLIFLQAARAMEVPPETFSSWVFAISMAAGVSSIALSLALRAPIVTAWSAPGTVLLITLGPVLPFSEIVGAYLAVALVLVVLGITGLFDRIVAAIPPAVASGMLAGILFGFGLDAMAGLGQAPLVFTVLLVAYLVLGALMPRYAMIALLVVALLLAWGVEDVAIEGLGLALATPTLTAPAFSWAAMLSLGVPLLITTLTGQFLPGLAILRANGYPARARSVLVFSGLASVPAALLGGITTALASITMALSASPEAHPDPARRYVAGVACGVFFCLGGLFAGSIVELLTLLPVSMIAMLAGFALLGAIQKSLTDTLTGAGHVQAGLLTFVVTTADADLFGIDAAFWGVVVGLAAVGIDRAVGAARRRGTPSRRLDPADGDTPKPRRTDTRGGTEGRQAISSPPSA